MKVVYTDAALKDLDAISDWLIIHYPAVAPVVGRRIRNAVARIARWPGSSRCSTKRPSVRTASLGRYPYEIFYQVTDDTVQILHIHHAAQQPWDEAT
jgi:toxin ParE1/3/4